MTTVRHQHALTAINRVAVLFAMVAAMVVLVVGAASAQSSDDCYPVPPGGCESSGETPSEQESPDPAATTGSGDGVTGDDGAGGDGLARTGIESSTVAFLAAGLVVVGGGAVVAGRRRSQVDA